MGKYIKYYRINSKRKKQHTYKYDWFVVVLYVSTHAQTDYKRLLNVVID